MINDPVEIFRKSIAQAQAAHDREIAALVKRAKTLEMGAASLRDSLMALLPPTVATGDVPNGGPPRTAKKRGPTTVTTEEVERVLAAMLGIDQPVTIKQLRGAVAPMGPKTIGAALRVLAERGHVTGPKRDKWTVAPNVAAQQGVDSELGSED